MLMGGFALMDHYNPPPPAPTHLLNITDMTCLFIFRHQNRVVKIFSPSPSLLSKPLPCKIISALSPAHTVKRGSPPTGLLPKEFSFHGQLSFLHLEETEPWHNYVSWLFSRFAGGLDLILKHYFYLTASAWLTSPDCAEALLKKIK